MAFVQQTYGYEFRLYCFLNSVMGESMHDRMQRYREERDQRGKELDAQRCTTMRLRRERDDL